MGATTWFGTPAEDEQHRARSASALRRIGGELRTDVARLISSTTPESFLGGPSLATVADGIDDVERLILAVADDLDRAAVEVERAAALAVPLWLDA
ncbi:MAG: hypothetical protein ACO3WU_00015 [Ilumatobacteraceae bacterium]